MDTKTIIWLVVAGVAVITAVILCVIFRQKLAKFLRVYKSEVKKIVWLPWPQTRKNTLLVLVVMLVCAAVICLLDLGLGTGFTAIIKAISNSAA